MTAGRGLGSAVVCAALAWGAPLAAEPPAQRLLEVGGEYWRAAGTVTSSVTGAELVILEEQASGRTKVARAEAPPFPGVAVLAVANGEVLLEVEGRPVRLAIGRGTRPRPRPEAAPEPAVFEGTEIRPAAPPAVARLRLSVAEFRESARVLREALRSGAIGPGHDARGIFGVVINASPPGGIVERLGLRPGDVVVAVNGRPAASEDGARALLDAAAPDREIPYAYRRGAAVGQGIVEIVAEPR